MKYKTASEMPETTEDEINRKWKCLVAEENDYRAIRADCEKQMQARALEMCRLANKVRALAGCGPATIAYEVSDARKT